MDLIVSLYKESDDNSSLSAVVQWIGGRGPLTSSRLSEGRQVCVMTSSGQDTPTIPYSRTEVIVRCGLLLLLLVIR